VSTSGTARTRSPWIIGAAVLFVVGVLWVGVTQLVEDTFRGSSVREEVLDLSFARVELATDQGDVLITPSPDGRVHYRAESQFGLREPQITAESGPTGVRLGARCVSGGGRCETTWTVAVPAAAAVTVDGWSGSVGVRDLTGPVDVETAGDVTLAGLGGEVTARTSYGEVIGTGLRTPSLTVSSRSADIDVTLVEAPRRVSLTSSDQGDIALAVPGTRPYRVDADHGLFGEERITIPHDPTADASLHATTTGGQVVVRPT
jgi:hypothetical protein